MTVARHKENNKQRNRPQAPEEQTVRVQNPIGRFSVPGCWPRGGHPPAQSESQVNKKQKSHVCKSIEGMGGGKKEHLEARKASHCWTAVLFHV